MKFDKSFPSRALRSTRNYFHELADARRHSIGFYNFWTQKIPDNWLYRFLESRNLLEKAVACRVNFFSVFGPRFKWDLIKGGKKVFYTGENVQFEHNRLYSDHALTKNTDLAIGFEYLPHRNYLRFPLWMQAMFPPNASEQEIIDICNKLTWPATGLRHKFVALVARHDSLGVRKDMYDKISEVGRVDCDGDLLHNNDDLKTLFNDDKLAYLKNYKINICPENSDTPGYVTEKIFHAISAGCIPVYWGSGNRPEPDVLNQQAILFWNPGQDNDGVIETISKLKHSDSFYSRFFQQPRLLEGAAGQVIDSFNALENKFREILTW